MPTISSFTPSSAVIGAPVVITGSGFTGATAVTIAGRGAAFTVDSDTQITATVPGGAVGIHSIITVTAGTTASTSGFTPLYAGPWLHGAIRTTTLTSVDFSDEAREANSEAGAAQMLAGDSAPTIVNHAVLGGNHYGTSTTGAGGTLDWYYYQQASWDARYNQADLIPNELVDPTAFTIEVDYTNWQAAVTAFDVDVTVTPGVLNDDGDLTSSSVRVVVGNGFGPGVPRTESGGVPLNYTLSDIWTAPNTAFPNALQHGSRAYSSGPGVIPLHGVPLSADSVREVQLDTTGGQVRVFAFLDRNDSPPLTGTSTDGLWHYVYWTLAGQVTITFTPLPLRNLFAHPLAVPLRQYPRDDALGGTPRQGHSSRSVQASTREGWAGTYR